jgi:nucleoside-diphosphate-sugar epimerase
VPDAWPAGWGPREDVSPGPSAESDRIVLVDSGSLPAEGDTEPMAERTAERVLVTGSSGLVGSAVAAMLRSRGSTVIGVDERPGPFTRVEGDLRRLDLGAIVERAEPTAVVHTAALHAPHVATRPPAEFWQVNVDVTSALVGAVRAAEVPRLVFTSTTSVYGFAMAPLMEAVWVDETLQPQPQDVYDETKLAAERLVALAHDDVLRTVTLRVGRCFPEEQQVVATHRMHRGVDLRDVVQAHGLALDAPIQGHLIANVAGPRVFEPTDCTELLVDAGAVIDRRLPGLRQAFASRGWALPATIARVYDSTRARTVLGYDPLFDTWSVLDPLPDQQHRRPA